MKPQVKLKAHTSGHVHSLLYHLLTLCPQSLHHVVADEAWEHLLLNVLHAACTGICFNMLKHELSVALT